MVQEILEQNRINRKKQIKKKIKNRTLFVVFTTIVLLGALTMIFPYLWMFLKS